MFDKITARSRDFFYGWWMVAVGCGMRMLGGGFHLYGFTIFFLPITQERHRRDLRSLSELCADDVGIIALSVIAGCLYAMMSRPKRP